MCITICEIHGQCKFKAGSRAPRAGALGQPRGRGWGGRWEGGSGCGGTHVYWWPIHVDVWKKPPQYCNYPPAQISLIKKKKNQGLVNKPNSLGLTPGFWLNISCTRPRNLHVTSDGGRYPSLWEALPEGSCVLWGVTRQKGDSRISNMQLAISSLPVSICMFPL